jgi:hypothetical protein
MQIVGKRKFARTVLACKLYLEGNRELVLEIQKGFPGALTGFVDEIPGFMLCLVD